jgi:hypothetical protein
MNEKDSIKAMFRLRYLNEKEAAERFDIYFNNSVTWASFVRGDVSLEEVVREVEWLLAW